MSDAPLTPAKSRNDADIFTVSATMNFFSWLICEHPTLWQALGRAESSILEDQIAGTKLLKPVWVSGLARSGSTLLLEILAGAPGVTSHVYKDFPAVFTPYAWNRLLGYMGGGNATPAERAHQDGIVVTLDSPEAMEEPLWMSFFPNAHNPQHNNIVEPGTHPAFATFLREHIGKLLAVRGAQRYLAKANYQMTRMEYLLDEFPDARFVVPVRDPVTHIASLIKTHELFSRGQAANDRARKHLQRVGHFEFGLDRQPINTGNPEVCEQIQALWAAGEEAEGWAIYWDSLYAYVLDRIEANPKLASAVQLVSFEKLCAAPEEQLRRALAHCDYAPPEDYIMKSAARIKAPSYYRPDFSSQELTTIQTLTAATVSRLETYTG